MFKNIDVLSREDAIKILHKISDMFNIGSDSRNESVICTNVENSVDDRFCKTFGAINNACGELPDDYRVVLYMENGAAYVEVEFEDIEELVSGEDMELFEQINEGVEMALKGF